MEIFFLQGLPDTVSTFDQITKVGSVLSLVLAIGVVVLWKQLLLKDKALAELNASVRKDALDSLRVIDGLTTTINKKSDYDEKTYLMMGEALTILKAKYTDKAS